MRKMRMNQAIAAALHDEMASDPTVLVMGEDVAAAGGPFKTTDGLLAEFGPKRVRDTPISEMGFSGAAVGAAALGLKPVVEIMFIEFLGVALDAVVTEAAKFRYLSRGAYTCPLVIRASVGSGLGFGCQHSQTLESWLTTTAGLKVVSPSDPQTAYGLMRAAIQDPDPVVILEPRVLYSQRGEVDRSDEGICALGRARVLREGSSATVVGLGQTTSRILEAVSEEELDVEVIDLLSVSPWDAETILKSVKKTGRMVTVEEAPETGGWGAGIVAHVAQEAFECLEGPPLRITTPDVPVPYAKSLEEKFLPSPRVIADQLQKYLVIGEAPAPWWKREGVL